MAVHDVSAAGFARQFLREDGAIFVNIGTDEASHLGVLMDEIFGARNRIAIAAWETAYTANQTAKHISETTDFIYIYALNFDKATVGKFERSEEQLAKFKNPDNDARGDGKAENLSAGKFYASGQFEISGPTGKKFSPSPGRYWRCHEAQFKAWLGDGRITFGKDGSGRPMLKKYLAEISQGLTPPTWWRHEDFATAKDASIELKGIFGGDAIFATPKPTRLLERILQIATNPDDLILDSFAGSGTTGHATLKLNHAALRKEPRRFILVEMEPKIARDITAERVRRVAEGYKSTDDEQVNGLGGSYRYCELGEPLFDESGKIREIVSFADLARHVYFTETGEPLPRERVTKSPFIGECRGVGIYLLYNGILSDKSVSGGNVLTRTVLAKLPKFGGQKVIYCAGCLLGKDRLQAEGILVRQTPYEIKVS